MWSIVGHEWAVELLARSIETKRLSHAYLIVGPAQVGKQTLARTFTQAILCAAGDAPCGTCRSCQLVEADRHPDVHVVAPEKGSIKIERVRSWESCQSPGFTRIAGGYNPRSTKGSRLRQRFAHKLLYFPEQFGALGCVGCGRCVRACPVNIDIREIIQDVQQLGVKSEA